jgi:nitroimidazol reductase NimA-like FMN-containing flavoprotein (pyridoxamine 5'-phosphate oxidase superfamily)
MVLTDYEDIRAFTLDETRQQELLTCQNECSFVWSTKDGWPVGVIMNYVWRDGKIWLTSSRQRKRIAAVQRDDRVSIIISGLGTPMGSGKTVTFKGHCRLLEDDETKAWFYQALAAAVFPGNDRRRKNFTRFLNSPARVILEVTPVRTTSHDSDKLSATASKTLKQEREADQGDIPLSTKRTVG